MSSTNRPLRQQFLWWGIVVVTVCAVSHFFITTSEWGISIWHDSVYFFSAAENLADGNGLLLWNGHRLVNWPPLYSILLSIGSLFGAETTLSATIIGTLNLIITVLLFAALLQKSTRLVWLSMIGTIAFLFSPAAVRMNMSALTEPLFVAATFCFVFTLSRYLHTYKSVDIIWAAMAAGAATLLRYPGVAIIGAGLLLILFRNPRLKLWQRIRATTLFLVCSSLPLLLWLIRNLVLTGNIAGQRRSSPYTLLGNLNDSLRVISGAVTPDWSDTFQFLLLGLALIAVVWNIVRMLAAKDTAQSEAITILLASFLSLAFYLIMTVFSATVVEIARLNERLLYPVIAHLILLFFATVGILFNSLHNQPFTSLRVLLRSALVIIVVCVSVNLCWQGFLASTRLHRFGYGLSSLEWRKDPLLKWLQDNPQTGILYTNADWQMAYFLEERTKHLPKRTRQMKKRFPPEHSYYVVWYDIGGNCKTPYTPESLEEYWHLRVIHECKRGKVLVPATPPTGVSGRSESSPAPHISGLPSSTTGVFAEPAPKESFRRSSCSRVQMNSRTTSSSQPTVES